MGEATLQDKIDFIVELRDIVDEEVQAYNDGEEIDGEEIKDAGMAMMMAGIGELGLGVMMVGEMAIDGEAGEEEIELLENFVEGADGAVDEVGE